jgi:hypothetical protein
MLPLGDKCTVTAVLYDANGYRITSGGDGALMSILRKSPATTEWELMN